MTIGVPTFYEQPSVIASTYDSVREMWWFINGSHPTAGNATAWPCVECWDGTSRLVPLNGDLSNLPGGNLWRPEVTPAGSLPEGGWAVFRSPGPGAVAAQFQVHVRMESAGRAKNSLITLDDWVTGSGTDASPTLPATMIGQPISGDDGKDWWDSETTTIWSVLVDEGMYLMKQFEPGGGFLNTQWEYMGEVEPVNSETDVPRPFIISRSLEGGGWTGSHQFTMLSPVDQLTVIELVAAVEFGYPVSTSVAEGWGDLGKWYLCNVHVWCAINVGHRFTVGFIRNAGAINKYAPSNRGTCGVGPTDYKFEVWSNDSNVPSIVTSWPPGTSLPGGHTDIEELSIPTQLVPATSSGGGDVTPPVVTYVDPPPGAAIRSDQAITVDVTDDLGGFANIQLRVSYPSSDPILPTETIYGGDELGAFESFYTSSTIATITNGFRFVLMRDKGWPSTPNFTASPIDSSGNIT